LAELGDAILVSSKADQGLVGSVPLSDCWAQFIRESSRWKSVLESQVSELTVELRQRFEKMECLDGRFETLQQDCEGAIVAARQQLDARIREESSRCKAVLEGQVLQFTNEFSQSLEIIEGPDGKIETFRQDCEGALVKLKQQLESRIGPSDGVNALEQRILTLEEAFNEEVRLRIEGSAESSAALQEIQAQSQQESKQWALAVVDLSAKLMTLTSTLTGEKPDAGPTLPSVEVESGLSLPASIGMMVTSPMLDNGAQCINADDHTSIQSHGL